MQPQAQTPDPNKSYRSAVIVFWVIVALAILVLVVRRPLYDMFGPVMPFWGAPD